ncbi:ragulator complex protein LAMTOR2 [Umbelopsis sp. AD052]|nr:ragulator complex protein LAMTOR2 [Umbelopsis sp. AD052]
MLKPKVISQVLRQTTTGGIKAAMLMNSGGSLLAFAAASDREARIYAAIAANLWSTYLKSAMTDSSFRNEADGDDLRILILPCEEGVVAVAAPSTMLLCLVGDSTIELGLLKAKVEAVSKHLQEPLERVASYQQ